MRVILSGKHRCSPWCHRCPDLDGDIMPGCYGTINAPDAGMDACTCAKPWVQAKSSEERLDLIAHVATRAMEAPYSPSQHRRHWQRVIQLLPDHLRLRVQANLRPASPATPGDA